MYQHIPKEYVYSFAVLNKNVRSCQSHIQQGKQRENKEISFHMTNSLFSMYPPLHIRIFCFMNPRKNQVKNFVKNNLRKKNI
jgi:hypothetical protein